MKHVLLLFLWLISLSLSAQTIRYVSTTGINTNPATATSWATSTTDLQGAINASQPGDQVWVAAGTYKPTTTTGPASRTISFALKNDVTVYGGFVGTETALSQRPTIDPAAGTPSSTTLSGDIGTVGDNADNSLHVFFHPQGLNLQPTAVLDGVVIQDGNANSFALAGLSGLQGGAMSNNGSRPTLTRCTLQNNSAQDGGAIYQTFGNATLTNCAFQNNTALDQGGAIYFFGSASQLTNCVFQNHTGAQQGGVIYCDRLGRPTLTNCLLRNNSAYDGGVSYCAEQDSGPIYVGCTLQDNAATNQGGAIHQGAQSRFSLTRCTLQNNVASSGGAIYALNSNYLLTNCYFVSNRAGGAGGAIRNLGSRGSLINCTLQNNAAVAVGGIVYNEAGGTLALTNCLLWANGGSSSIYTFDPTNVTANYCLAEPSVTSYTGANNQITSFTPFAPNNAPSLNACTEALNAGDPNTYQYLTDVNDVLGQPRFSGRIDIGATEFQGPVGQVQRTGITRQPTAQTIVCQGATVTASVSVSGSPGPPNGQFIYQWYKDGTLLANQTAATLILPFTTTAQSGSYSAVVTGLCNSVTSTAFSLTVGAPVAFTQQPASSSLVCERGGSISVPVSVSGTVTRYQWYKIARVFGQPPQLLTDQTSATLTIPTPTTADAGGYFVVATGPCNEVYSSNAFGLFLRTTPTRLYVRASQTQNTPDGLSWNTAFPDLQQALNYDGCSQNLAEIWVAAGTYKPTSGTDQTVSFQMRPGVAIYGGFVGTETDLSQRPAVNPVATAGRPAQPSSTTLSGNLGGILRSYHVVYNPPSLSLTASAVLDGFVIADGVGLSNAGTYPDNAGAGLLNDGGGAGNVCSPTIRNTLFINNYAYTGGAVTNSAQLGGTSQPTFENCAFQNNSANFGGAVLNTAEFGAGTCSPIFRQCVFERNTAFRAGGAQYIISSNGGTVRPLVVNSRFLSNEASGRNGLGGAVYVSNGGSSTANLRFVGCSFESNSASGAQGQGGVFTNAGPSGFPLQNPIALGLTNCSFRGNSATSFGSLLNNQGTNATLTNCVVWGNSGAAAFQGQSSTTTATYSLFDAASATGLSSNSPTNLTTNSSPYAGANGTQLASNSPAIDLGLNTAPDLAGITTDLAGNPRFQCRIDAGAYEFEPILAITQQPASASVVCVGSVVSVPVSVSSSGTSPTFQWFKDGVLVGGQTSATLTLANVPATASGSYSLVVTGACNSLTSTAFSLTVNAPVAVTRQPGSSTAVCVGGSLNVPTSASGTVTGYQWFKDGQILTGQTSATLALTNLQTADAGSYWVVVTGACNSTTSTAFNLTFNQFIAIEQPPSASASVLAGSAVRVPTRATGTVQGYQWFRDGQLLIDQRTPTLTLFNSTTADAGRYVVVVTGACNSLTSTAFDLSVNTPTPTTSCAGSPLDLNRLITTPTGSTVSWSLRPPATAISASGNHNLVLLANGSILAWGRNIEGQITVPASATPATAIAAAFRHSLAIRPNGTVVGWHPVMTGQSPTSEPAVAIAGGSLNSQALLIDGRVVAWGSNSTPIAVPASAMPATAIAGGFSHNLSLRADGRVVSWDMFSGERAVPALAAPATAISAGDNNFSLALLTNGDIAAWGGNQYGQTSVPASAMPAKAIAAGGAHGVALRTDGTVVAWGDNQFGQTRVPALSTPPLSIAAGYFHNLALLPNGSVVAWGLNDEGQVANYDAQPVANPLVSPIASQTYYYLIRNADGSTTAGSLPVEVRPITSLATQPVAGSVVCVGSSVNVPVSATGTGPFTYQWFRGGQVVTGQTSATLTLTNLQTTDAGSYSVIVTGTCNSVTSTAFNLTVNPLAAFVQQPPATANVVAGDAVRIPTRATGTVSTYQWFRDGQVVANQATPTLALFNTTPANTGQYVLVVTGACNSVTSTAFSLSISNPTPVTSCVGTTLVLSDLLNLPVGSTVSWSLRPPATAIAAGGYHNLALLANGAVLAWGWNENGQTTVPASATPATAIAAGYGHSLALRPSGAVVGWGLTNFGQTSVPASATPATAIAAGYYHSLALRPSGAVLAWGWNEYGQTSVPASVTPATAIATGYLHNLALLANGNILAWGNNEYSQTSVPASATPATAIAAGGYHSLALLPTGGIAAWGWNEYGQTSVPASATPAVAIAAGGGHSLALLPSGAVVGWGLNEQGQTSVPALAASAVAIGAGDGHSLALLANGSVVGWGLNDNGQAEGYDVQPVDSPVVSLTASQTYYYLVRNADGSTRAGSLSVNVGSGLPLAFVQQPASASAICVGSSVAVPVSVTGTSPAYQWYKDGQLVAGQTSATLTLPTTTTADAGRYVVVVTGTCNSLTSTAFSLTVNTLPSPTLTPMPSATLTCALPSLTLTATGGSHYTFAGPAGGVLGQNAAAGTALVGAPGTYTVAVTNAAGCSATSTTVISQNTTPPPASLTATSLSFCAGTSLTLMAGGGTSYTFSAGATQLGGSAGNTATVTAAGTYSVTVTGANGCTSTASLSVSTVAVTTLTNALPASVSYCEGDTPASLSITATGDNLTYQWHKNGAPLPGQTAPTLAFTAATPADGGSYYVIVSGTCGTVSSNTMAMTIRPRMVAPTLAAVSFTVVASPTPLPLAPFVVATGTLSFSGTSGPLSPPNANISSVGVQSFSVSQTNQFGCASPATVFSLSVLSPLPPASQSSCRGSNVVLNVPDGSSRYEWYRNGQSVASRLNNIAGVYAGATTASLTAINAQTSGTFYAKVFAANGSFVWYGPFAVSVVNCGAREAAAEPELTLQVRVVPNPLVNSRLRAMVAGAGGQALTVELTDMQGRVIRSQRWEMAQAEQVVEWDVSQAPPGTLLLRAEADGRSQTVKVAKE
jgi:predicted outer membrane repeat protein